MLRYKVTTNQVSLSVIIISILFGLLGVFLWIESNFSISEVASLAVTNRSINTLFGALITAMALIITLTSNLYSPRLAKVFVAHPLTVTGVGYILLTNMFITISHLITYEHPWFRVISFVSFTLTIIAMFGVIPFLYLISRFVKPSYFIPLMGQYAQYNLNKMHKNKYSKKTRKRETYEFFEYVDVISNMASTAIQRKDKSVLSLVSIEMFTLTRMLIKYKNTPELNSVWRKKHYVFSPGLSEEGRYYLKKYQTWPEAYLLSKILEMANSLSKSENEIVPMICRELTTTNDIAINLDDKKIVSLLLTILNAMTRSALETKSEQKLSSILYYYRMNIELLIGHNQLCNRAIKSFLEYGVATIKKNEMIAAKNFLFDLGRILNYLSFEDEDISTNLYETHVKKTWCIFIEAGGEFEVFTRQSIVKTFWNLYSQNYHSLTNIIRKDFLKNNLAHAKVLKEMLKNEDPLDSEFGDTLICVEYLSGMALSLAKDFLGDFTKVLEEDDEQEKHIAH